MTKKVKKLPLWLPLALLTFVCSILLIGSMQVFAATATPNITKKNVTIEGTNATINWTDANKVSNDNGRYVIYVKGPDDSDYGKELGVFGYDNGTPNEYWTTFTVSKNGVYSVKVEYLPSSSMEATDCFVEKFAYVKMDKPKTLTAKTTGYTSIKLSWSKVSNAAGYYIYRSNAYEYNFKKIKTITSGSTTSYTNSKLKKSNAYEYYVVPYAKFGDFVSLGGPKSSTKTVRAGVNKVSTFCINSYSNKIRMDIGLQGYTKSCDSVNGYKIYRATSKNGKYKLVKTIKSKKSSVKYVDSGLKSGKKYYYKVKAYRVISGKKYYSGYSKVQSIKVTSKNATQVNARVLYTSLRNSYGAKKVKVNNIYTGKAKKEDIFVKKGTKVVVIDAYLTDSKGKKSRKYVAMQCYSDPLPYISNGYTYDKMPALTSKSKLDKSKIIKW